MAEICSRCGLPKELCVCELIAKQEQTIEITIVKRRFGKLATVITGLDPKSINIKDLARTLKSKLACGGTVKNNVIELQGNHLEKVKAIIIAEGFSSGSIKTRYEKR